MREDLFHCSLVLNQSFFAAAFGVKASAAVAVILFLLGAIVKVL